MCDNFAVFILTHGRPDKVITYNTLKKQGYTGPVFLVVDNEDDTIDRYREQYKNQVVVFDKLAISKTFDEGDNFNDRRAVIYARNACFEIAKDLGIEYFLELDDDYSTFIHKFTASLQYREKPTRNLDRLFSLMLEYYKSIPALTIAFAQNGDFIGGKFSSFGQHPQTKRKCMNTFFCSTLRPFSFFGRINEDVNTYVTSGNRGSLLLTINNAAVIQSQTQSTSGGMTDIYLNQGTYIKSFYTVMYAPSCTKVFSMGATHQRLHHRVTWANAVPCIVEEKYRKSSQGHT